jgi:ethanolamine ammonia-lyase small subunit
MITQAQVDALVDAIVSELQQQAGASDRPPRRIGASADVHLDLPDIAGHEYRAGAYVDNPKNPAVLSALKSTTPARIGTGHAGPRYRNIPQLIFWADHAITQDALFKEIDPNLLNKLDLFEIQTRASNRQEYLLRPDLGRLLSDAARVALSERCVKQPDVQIYVADGLSAAAIEHNLSDMLPVMRQGLEQARLKIGTLFYVKYGRVGLMNDVNSIVDAQVVVCLIGERPGLGRAEAMSAYMGYRPRPDSTDADRDVVCNIYNGGTNPLEAGAYVVEYIKRMLKYRASGIQLKLQTAQ